MSLPIRRGAVVVVRLDPTTGHELRKTRPAVVLSNDAACRADAVIQVVPCTGLPDRQLRPYEARVGPGRSGLAKPSRVVANQIRTVDRARVTEVLGMVDADELRAIAAAVRIQLGL